MILDTFKRQAPVLPQFTASYRSIYFEPIIGSGERFVIGIMALAETGESRVLQTLSEKTMRSMYGDKTDQIRGLVSLILESAESHLKAEFPLEQWQPPVSGAFAGMTQKTYSNNGLEGVLFQAITSYASLYKGKIVKDGLSELTDNELPEDEAERNTDSLIQQVKNILQLQPIDYQSHWKKVVRIKENSAITIDYLGARYNANLSNFDVKDIGNALKVAKAKLFDLDVLREKRQHEVFSSEQNYELLIGLKNDAPNDAKDCFVQIEQLADTKNLRVIKKATPQEMADRILLQEKAA
ncbi:hypothetical protein MGMO_8c01190 [Methyloglobulus morosus KoM1]|uniref:Uncharacterized protein n=1 Tax=Methyloglobulus morosus KoM1 TaxID=1116472 RepID=V5BKY0_9GAMM|nr:hypothetical protein [Methyloglobulus morosus]ESS73980.1 hypothetical protein MGMO_8c01190 [Methyloglobulus morosus KoM1]